LAEASKNSLASAFDSALVALTTSDRVMETMACSGAAVASMVKRNGRGG